MASLYPNLDSLAGAVPYYNHIVKLFETDKALKQTTKGILQQVCYTAAGTVVGGIVGGPLGAAVGSLIGTGIGYMRVDNYDSLLTVLRDLNAERRQQLVTSVQELVGSTSTESLTEYIANQAKRELFVNLVNQFVSKAK